MLYSFSFQTNQKKKSLSSSLAFIVVNVFIFKMTHFSDSYFPFFVHIFGIILILLSFFTFEFAFFVFPTLSLFNVLEILQQFCNHRIVEHSVFKQTEELDFHSFFSFMLCCSILDAKINMFNVHGIELKWSGNLWALFFARLSANNKNVRLCIKSFCNRKMERLKLHNNVTKTLTTKKLQLFFSKKIITIIPPYGSFLFEHVS